jgi:GcrA cell cycle regulator
MGKFDLDQKYDETQSKTYTLIDLIHEIITEHGETYETCVGAEYSVKCKNIKYKFKNKDKSGIIDKLNMYFNFDVEQLGKKSPQESFKMLQLLNYLYKLDKHKRIKKVEKENKAKSTSKCKAKEKPIVAEEPKPQVAPIEETNIPLVKLDNHTCRWPMGDPKDEDFCFCGKRIKTGQTYCEEHAMIAYVKAGKKI